MNVHVSKQPRLWFATIGLVAVVAMFVWGVLAYLGAVRLVDHTLEVQRELDRWLSAVRHLDREAHAFVDTGENAALARFSSSVETQRHSAALLRELVVDNAVQLRDIDQALAEAESIARLLQELTKGGSRVFEASERIALREALRVASDRFEAHCLDVQKRESELLIERRERAKQRVLLLQFLGAALGAIAFALLFVAWASRAEREALLKQAALDAQRRLRALSDVAVALSEARSPSEVAQAVVDIGMQALGADICTLYRLDESGEVLELIGERGTAPALVAKLRCISATAGNPIVFATLQGGEALWVEDEVQYRNLLPQVANLEAEGPRAKAFWSMPLTVEGRPVGLLGMGFYRERSFSPDDRVLVDTLSKHCGQALVRATRLESEESARVWFTTTLRSIGDAVIATDPRGKVTFMNPIAEALTGYSESEARGRHLDEVFQIYSEQAHTPVESPVSKVLREGKVVGLANHTILRAKGGEELPIDDSGAPIRNEQGELIGVVMVFRDVSKNQTERARREFLGRAGEALVRSLDYQATLQTIAELAVGVIADWCAIDVCEPGTAAPRQAAVHHVDPLKVAFVRELGKRYPPDPNAKTGAPQVIRSGKSEMYPHIPAAMLEAASNDRVHLELLRELGLHSAMCVPITSHGRILGAITFVYAESKRRYGEDDLAFAEDFARRAAMAIENALMLRQVEESRAKEHQLRGDAEIASRAKDEFLAMVSHELRTPLNAILGWTVMLRAAGSPENFERGLAVIERNARAQAKLIEDVLDVSRIISGKLLLSLGPTVVSEAINAAVETVTPAAEAKGIRIVAHNPDQPISITADAQRIQQIVWNLLSNAVKFTPKGGSVTVRSQLRGSDVGIEVSDTGEGIRPTALPYVFEPFAQADTSTTRRHGGLGLGLAIVKQLVSAHGGTVRANSEGEGKGAAFVVELPARGATPAVGVADGPEPPRARVLPAHRVLGGLRLLVVDDEEDALDLVSAALSAHGAQVYSVGSAREALLRVENLELDVIVSDIGMPDEDGYSLIRKIRALPPERGGRTPAVALTAYARAEDAQRAFAAGYQLHMAKPVDPSHLARAVANLGGRTLQVDG